MLPSFLFLDCVELIHSGQEMVIALIKQCAYKLPYIYIPLCFIITISGIAKKNKIWGSVGDIRIGKRLNIIVDINNTTIIIAVIITTLIIIIDINNTTIIIAVIINTLIIIINTTTIIIAVIITTLIIIINKTISLTSSLY